MGICRHCGFPTVLLGAKFCPECGKPFPVALDDPAVWRTTKKTGTCRICGYQPIAFEATTCPSCGGKTPHPGTISRFVGRGQSIGFLVGGVGGAVLGLTFAVSASAPIVGYLTAPLGGFLAGSLLGIFFGYVIGSFAGGVIAGMRNE